MHPQLFFALFALTVLALTVAAVDPAAAAAASIAASVLGAVSVFFAATVSATASVLAPAVPAPAAPTALADASPVALGSTPPAPAPLGQGNVPDDAALSQWHRIHGHLDNGVYYTLGLLILCLQASGYYDNHGEWDEDDAGEEVQGDWERQWEGKRHDGADDNEGREKPVWGDMNGLVEGMMFYAIVVLSLASFASQLQTPPNHPASWYRIVRMVLHLLAEILINDKGRVLPRWLWHVVRWGREVAQAWDLFAALRMAGGRPTLLDLLLPAIDLYYMLKAELYFSEMWYRMGWQRMLKQMRQEGFL